MGTDIGQDFFKLEVYQSAEAAGRQVPWDIGGAQPALG
jgi:hypothetical protein